MCSNSLIYLFKNIKLKQNLKRILAVIFLLFFVLINLFTSTSTNLLMKGVFYQDYETKSMIVSEFLSKNLPEGYVIYSNQDYPIIAFYSGKPIEHINYRTFPENVVDSFFVHYIGEGKSLEDHDIESKYRLLKRIENVNIYEIKK